jgi:hypothetical protein
MLSLATPLWLTGLVAVPLLWWLHRWRDTGQRIAVSALFLWRPAAQGSAAGQRLARPDPLWRLRAGIVVCLLLALAGPRWQVQQPAIAIWLDDSLSMYTLEDGVSRLVVGIDKLLQALQQAAYPKVTVHSLANPAKTLVLDAAHSERWRFHLLAGFHSPAGNEPLPPPAVQMDSHAEHWLVSDGVHPAVQDWLQTAPVTRVIQVGKVRENVALTTLAARFPLTESGTLRVLIIVANPGEQAAERELELVLDGRAVYRQKLELAPGARVRQDLHLPSGLTLHARLSPADALPLDDELLLSLPAPVKLRIEGNCGPSLRTALAAHPRLQPVETDSAALTVACLDIPPIVNGPLLLLHSAQNGRPVRDIPRWQPAAGALQQLVLEPGWLVSMPVQPHPAASEPLLTAGDNPLILSSAGPARVIDVLLDMEAPEWVRRHEYPVLVQGLIDLALGRALLGEFTSIQRDPKASQIAPRPLQLMEKASVVRPAADSKDLSPGLLGVCGLLLLLDMWRQYRLAADRC